MYKTVVYMSTKEILSGVNCNSTSLIEKLYACYRNVCYLVHLLSCDLWVRLICIFDNLCFCVCLNIGWGKSYVFFDVLLICTHKCSILRWQTQLR